MSHSIVTALIPTTTDLIHLAQWVAVLAGIVLGFLAVSKAVDRIRQALTEQEPIVDDVTERRRMKAEAFAERRRQLEAASGVRR